MEIGEKGQGLAGLQLRGRRLGPQAPLVAWPELSRAWGFSLADGYRCVRLCFIRGAEPQRQEAREGGAQSKGPGRLRVPRRASAWEDVPGGAQRVQLLKGIREVRPSSRRDPSWIVGCSEQRVKDKVMLIQIAFFLDILHFDPAACRVSLFHFFPALL